MSDDGMRVSFLADKYEKDRIHELELNKATAAYEHSSLSVLTLLSGGAVGAFLTLLGTVWKEQPRPSIGFVIAANIAWCLGLLCTALTTFYMYKSQQGYSKAYRVRRQALELLSVTQLQPTSFFSECEWTKFLGVAVAPGAADETPIKTPIKKAFLRLQEQARLWLEHGKRCKGRLLQTIMGSAEDKTKRESCCKASTLDKDDPKREPECGTITNCQSEAEPAIKRQLLTVAEAATKEREVAGKHQSKAALWGLGAAILFPIGVIMAVLSFTCATNSSSSPVTTGLPWLPYQAMDTVDCGDHRYQVPFR